MSDSEILEKHNEYTIGKMVDNNAQQINTFVSGMDLDTSDQYLDSKQYREAYNLRVAPDMNGTGGSLTNIEGVRFYQYINTQLPEDYELPRIIQVDSVRKYGVILVKALHKTTQEQYYFIFRFVNKDDLKDGEDGTPKLIFGPCPTSLGENPSTVTRWEDEDNIKLYYADGENPIRVINISPLLDDTRNMTDDGSMSIYPTATLSQPEFLRYGSGNLLTGTYQYGYQLFTKNGPETEVSPLTNLIQVSPTVTATDSSGSISGGESTDKTNVAIVIRIPLNDRSYNMIRIISVYYTNVTDAPRIQILRELPIRDVDSEIVFQDVSNLGMTDITTEELNMITSVQFSPKILETKNNYLFASDIQYKDSVFDVDYDSRAYSGLLINDPFLTDTYTILLSNSGDMPIIARTNDLTVSGSGGIKDTHDCINPFSNISLPYTSFINSYTHGMDLNNAKCAYIYDFPNGYVYGGKGPNIRWRFVVTELEEVSEEKLSAGQTLYERYGTNNLEHNTLARDFQGVWCANIDKDGKFINRHFRQLSDEIIKIPCNFSSQIIRSNCMSLQRDELYRYGIVMYNKHGNATPVKWIADIRVPAAYEKGFEPFIANSFTSFLPSGEGQISTLATRPIGIEFEVNNLPDGVVSYEIVRVRRTVSDRATLTQGMISRSLKTSENSYPTWVVYNGNSYFSKKGNTGISETTEISDKTIQYEALSPYTMFSPEICYNRTSVYNSIPKNEAKLEFLYSLFSSVIQPYTSVKHNKVLSTVSRLGSFPTAYMRKPVSTDVLLPFFSQGTVTESIDQAGTEVLYTQNMYTMAAGKGCVKKAKDYTYDSGMFDAISAISLPTETDHTNHLEHSDFVSSVHGKSYVDWSASMYEVKDNIPRLIGAQGPGGRCLILDTPLFKTKYEDLGNRPTTDVASTFSSHRSLSENPTVPLSDLINSQASPLFDGIYNESYIGGLVCNMRQSVIPYGGLDFQSRQFTTYISQFAHSLSTNTKITIFSGDTFINVMTYIKTHYFRGINAEGDFIEDQYANVMRYNVPFESSINLSLQNGQFFNWKMQKEPGNISSFIQEKPMYRYNPVFSVESQIRPFTAEWYLDELNKHIDVRTYYSLKKSNDEMTDSWTKFKPLNYLDVDSQYGSINNVRTFGTQLVFWQDSAVGLYQVEDRSLIQDSNNSALLLGTSGVMERYDYVNTKNGMKKNHHGTDCQSDTTLYFFDYDKNELCAYSQNQVGSLGKLRSVQSYLDRIGLNKDKQSPKPILTYDKKYNEVIATIGNEESLVYSERLQAFTSFYTLVPEFRIYFDGQVYFVKGENLSKYNDGMVNNGFDDVKLPIRLNYLVNADFGRTKVFDNMEFIGELVKDNIRFDFMSSYLQSTPLHGSELSNREYNYRGAIPRVASDDKFANRMRGRVLYCTMTYDMENKEGNNIVTIINEEFMQTIVDSSDIITNNVMPNKHGDGSRFELPYIRTTFRISKS